MNRALALALLVLANLLWGSTWVVAKLALTELSPLQVSAWRMIAAGLVVLPWLVHQQRRGALPLRAWPQLAGLGALGFGVAKFLSFWGLSRTTATDASLLMSVEPLLTIALGWLVLREALSGRRAAAFLLGAAGAWLLIARGLEPPAAGAPHVVGDLVFLLGLTGEAAYSVLGKSLLRRHSAALVTAATIVTSMGLWLPVAVGDGLRAGWPPLNAGVVAALAFLALGCTVFAFWAWFRALEQLEAGLAALTIFVQPVWGAALSVLLLGEPLQAATLAGGALVLASLYLALAPLPGPR
ncbi:MAG TPA: DMT family transporter [bacterium]|nr:DMT family transporter [bacterium]